MTRTTPPRPVDVAVVLPELAPLARTATRLHPRPGSPSPSDSSVGGPLLWPAAEPWPHCDGPHEPDGVNPATSLGDVLLLRRIRAAAASRSQSNPQFTPYESSVNDRISAARPWPEGPVPLLSVAQLYVRDIPLLRPPRQADLLQVLWCPFEHPPQPHPATTVFWRSAAEVTGLRTQPPEPAPAQYQWYVPEPCLVDPEQVTEYPHPLELSQDLQELLGEWSRRQAAGTGPASSSATDPEGFYRDELSVAPGWKVGGWTHWGLTDPIPQFCPACDTEMAPLLTIASTEWDDSTRSWIPYEDQADAALSAIYPDPANPAMIMVASGYDLQLYACPAFPDHPHTALVQ